MKGWSFEVDKIVNFINIHKGNNFITSAKIVMKSVSEKIDEQDRLEWQSYGLIYDTNNSVSQNERVGSLPLAVCQAAGTY